MPKIKEEIQEEAKTNEVNLELLKDCVNSIKLIQAAAAVTGKGKFDSKDASLLGEGRAKGLAGNDLVKFIYIGRAGLVEPVEVQQARLEKAKVKKK